MVEFYIFFGFGAMALLAALVLVLSAIRNYVSREQSMSFIQATRARLSACGNRLKVWWYLLKWFLRKDRTMCVNCGPLARGFQMTSCRMVDRCRLSQAREWINAGEPVPEYLGGRVLCIKCAEANKYTCWVCELEKASEEKAR